MIANRAESPTGQNNTSLNEHTFNSSSNNNSTTNNNNNEANNVDNRTNRCRVCGKTYARPSTLKTHMRTHSVSSCCCCWSRNNFFFLIFRAKNHTNATNVTRHLHKQQI